MIQYTPESDLFNQKLRNSLELETKTSRSIRFTKHANVNTWGYKPNPALW